MDKTAMLNEIQNHYRFKKNSEFAFYLGITPQVLTNWKARNVFDFELVYAKCVDLNPDWILTGKGRMLKKQFNNSFDEVITASPALVNETTNEAYNRNDISREEFLEEQVKFYREKLDFYTAIKKIEKRLNNIEKSDEMNILLKMIKEIHHVILSNEILKVIDNDKEPKDKNFTAENS